MKYIKFITIALLPILFLSNTNVSNSDFIKDTNKELVPLVKDSLYISKYEVTNGQYKVFLENLKQKGELAQYIACKYDSTVWATQFKFSYNEPMTKKYHTHDAFLNYPINNISFVATQKYCSWLSNKYNSFPKRKFKKVVFRLPSEAEWLMAANSNNNSTYPWNGKEYKNKAGQYYANLKYHSEQNGNAYNYPIDGGMYTTMRGKYPKTENGIYDLIGNVSEMIQKEGFAKGGSWNDLPEDSELLDYQQYSGPDATVGFRWIMEVIEK